MKQFSACDLLFCLVTVYEKFDNEQNWCKFLPLVLFDHHTGPKCFSSLHLAQDQDATVKLIQIATVCLIKYNYFIILVLNTLKLNFGKPYPFWL